MAHSSELGAGDIKGLKSQYNDLRKDILNNSTGHDHSGATNHGTQVDGSKILDNFYSKQGRRRFEFKQASSNKGTGDYDITVTWDTAFAVINGLFLGIYASDLPDGTWVVKTGSYSKTGATIKVGRSSTGGIKVVVNFMGLSMVA